MYKALHQAIKQFFPELKIKDYIRQSRNPDRKSVYLSLKNKNIEPTTIEEFGVKFKIKFNEHYDIGIYTDMSALRGEIIKKLKPESHFLNLFSYTGAFSLQAAKKKIYATSVDLSKKFLDWSEENCALNPDIAEDYLENICGDALKVTSKFAQEKRVFDAILMDPPSFSSNKKKGSNALDSYKSFLPLFDKILSNDGSLFIFLNNHSEKRKKFEETIEGIIKTIVSILKLIKNLNSLTIASLTFPTLKQTI
jgi:23S rRNA (cytosine1962-C5)-methyltransferase